MTVSVNGIALSEELTLTGPGKEPLIAMSVRHTFGRPVVQGLAKAAGRTLVLAALRQDGGILGEFTGAQENQLAALRDAMQEVELVHHRGVFRVVITAVDLEPHSGVVDPGDTTRMIGSVTMIEV